MKPTWAFAVHELWLALKQERLDLQGQLQGTAAVPDAFLSADLLPLHSTTPPCTIPPLSGSYGDGVKYGLYYRPGEAQLSTFGNVRRTGSLAAHAAAVLGRRQETTGVGQSCLACVCIACLRFGWLSVAVRLSQLPTTSMRARHTSPLAQQTALHCHPSSTPALLLCSITTCPPCPCATCCGR